MGRALRLVADPRGAGAKQLQGHPKHWSLRVGRYRIIYSINDDDAVVYLRRIDLRDRAYRRIR